MLYVINLITIFSLSLVLCVSRRVAISMVVLCVYVCQFTYCFAFDYSAVFIYNIMTVFAVCMLGGWEQSARGMLYIFDTIGFRCDDDDVVLWVGAIFVGEYLLYFYIFVNIC